MLRRLEAQVARLKRGVKCGAGGAAPQMLYRPVHLRPYTPRRAQPPHEATVRELEVALAAAITKALRRSGLS
jgi:hypothetical protein